MKAEPFLESWQRRLKDFSKPLREIADRSMEEIDRAIAQRRSLDGIPWPAELDIDEDEYRNGFRVRITPTELTIENTTPLFPIGEGENDLIGTPIPNTTPIEDWLYD